MRNEEVCKVKSCRQFYPNIMKFIALFFLTSLTVTSFAQITNYVNTNYKKEVLYFLDSVKIDKNVMYFDPNKIAEINVVKEKDPTKFYDGKIYIKSKNSKDFNFLTLKGIEKTYTKTVSPSTLFMIDNLILKDAISTYKIDSAYILNVEVVKSTEIEYLKNSLTVLTIINIKLKTKENLEKASTIYIRGTDYSLPNLYNRNE